MSTLEAALRGGAAALLAFLAVAALHGRRRSKAQPFSALLAASAGAYAVVSAPDLVHQHAVWLAPLRLLSIGTPAVFWLWAAACFDDEFQPSWEKFLPWVVLVSLGAFCILGGWFVFWPAVKALALLFASLAVWQALSGRASDLVETRRHFRVILAIGAGLFIAAITITEVVPVGSTGGIPDTTLNAAGLVVVAFAFALMRLFEERDTALVPQPSPSPLLSDRPAKPIPADPQEPALLAALRGRGGAQHHDASRPTRHPGISAAPLDQPATRAPQLQQLCQWLPPRRGKGRTRRSHPGRGADPDDRARCRLSVDRAI